MFHSQKTMAGGIRCKLSGRSQACRIHLEKKTSPRLIRRFEDACEIILGSQFNVLDLLLEDIASSGFAYPKLDRSVDQSIDLKSLELCTSQGTKILTLGPRILGHSIARSIDRSFDRSINPLI